MDRNWRENTENTVLSRIDTINVLQITPNVDVGQL